MSRTQWNDAEDEAMHGLPWIAQLVYLRGIRQYMDYSSGVVGVKRGISLKSLAEVLHVEHGQGRRDAGDPTQKAIRHALELLERAGLIERIPADRQLVFRLPLADVDSSASKKWGRRGADVGQTKQGTEDPSNSAAPGEMRGRRAADPDPEKWGTPQESGIRKSEAKASGAEAPGSNPKTAIWNLGEQYLGSRALVGKLIKQHGEPQVFHAIAETANKNPADPKTYLLGTLSAKAAGKVARPTLADRNRSAMEEWLSGSATTTTGNVFDGEFCREA